MFNSLANLLFGSNANTSTNPESTDQIEQILEDNNTTTSNTTNSSLQATASTTTATSIGRYTDNNNQNVSNRSVEDHLKKLISIDHNNDDDVTNVDELDDDWLLVNREDDEEDSLPRTDSEEELPFVEIKRSPTFQQRPTRNSNHHSLSAYHQRTIALRYDGGGLTQSLYVVPSSADCNNGNAITTNLPTHMSMEESWFLTPPPCFTSTGPVNMETSPFENLLIEHPSMSVYHSIRSAQEAAESFINLDLGVEESQNGTMVVIDQPTGRNQSVAPRVARNRVERLNPTQCKMEYLTRSAQKVHDKKERQTICRGAIKRSNKVREYNSKSNRQRRSDMQHSKISSGANNNRKC